MPGMNKSKKMSDSKVAGMDDAPKSKKGKSMKEVPPKKKKKA